MIFGLIPGLARLIVGRRNVVRPVEIAAALVWMTATIWLFWVFPFNFANLGNVLPSSLRFLLSWIPNILGQFVLLVGALAWIGQFVYTIPLYLRVRQLMKVAPAEERKASLETTT